MNAEPAFGGELVHLGNFGVVEMGKNCGLIGGFVDVVD